MKKYQSIVNIFTSFFSPHNWAIIHCELRAGRVATSGSVAGNTLHLTFPQGEAWTPGDNPDVLIFPGGEMTPFRLTVGEGPGIAFNARGESLPEPQEAP